MSAVFGSPRLARRLAGAVGAVTVVAYLLLLGPRPFVDAYAGREAIVEHLGAAAFLGTSIAFFLASRRVGRGHGWRRAAYLLLGAFFFIACGEELSWGQHALGYSTPETVRELNAQDEMNLHNLWWLDSYADDGEKKSGWRAILLNSNRLFDLFMLGFFVVLPLLPGLLSRGGPLSGSLSDPLRGLLERLEPPTPALAFASVFVLTLASTAAFELIVVDDVLLHLSVSEVREMTYGLIALAAAAWLLHGETNRAESP